jgi:hypothetical protein
MSEAMVGSYIYWSRACVEWFLKSRAVSHRLCCAWDMFFVSANQLSFAEKCFTRAGACNASHFAFMAASSIPKSWSVPRVNSG